MTVLIARLGAVDVDWLGTSMGGLIGMQLAAAAQLAHTPPDPQRHRSVHSRRRRWQRIGDYVGKDPHFASLDELEAYLRKSARALRADERSGLAPSGAAGLSPAREWRLRSRLRSRHRRRLYRPA